MVQRRSGRYGATRRRGFTLLEVLLVVAILVALAAIAVPNLISTQESSNIDQAKLNITAFENMFKKYYIDTKQFPTTEQGFQALLAPPNPPVENWRGPYLEDPSAINDPWNMPYNYAYPGRHNQQKPDIWSNGPDRQPNTADDIGNWPRASR